MMKLLPTPSRAPAPGVSGRTTKSAEFLIVAKDATQTVITYRVLYFCLSFVNGLRLVNLEVNTTQNGVDSGVVSLRFFVCSGQPRRHLGVCMPMDVWSVGLSAVRCVFWMVRWMKRSVFASS